MKLSCTVDVDDTARQVCALFDYDFKGVSEFDVPPFTAPIRDLYGIVLIVGPSGSGKSTLLRQFGAPRELSWDERKPIVSHFANACEAYDRLSAVGLNSIPSWMRPYHVLSTGEKFRADLARRIESDAVIDEFTSVVDRNVAKSCANALRRYVTRVGLTGVVVASCHYDIIPWLQPDAIFDTMTGQWAGRGLERRPPIHLRIEPCGVEAWAAFSQHHYLTGAINKSARCWLASWGNVPVAFASALAFPNANFERAWREHRTVVLPDFQGLGIGVAVSNAVAQMFKDDGCRYFSKTAHPRFGDYRDHSPLWRPTSKNRRDRKDYSVRWRTKEDGHKMRHAGRVCYSHEYVGLATSMPPSHMIKPC